MSEDYDASKNAKDGYDLAVSEMRRRHVGENVRISDIEIGTRHRKDMGDIAGLSRSIEAVGLLHPIVVTPNNTLIAGERRVEAFKVLGWDEIPATIIDIDAIARGERAENQDRKDFLPSEAVAIRGAIIEVERKAANSRMSEGGKGRKISLPSQSRDKAAAGTGKSGRTLDKAAEIVAAAEAEPDKFGKLKDDMDRTGRVDGPYKRLKVTKQAEQIRKEPPPLPNSGPYRVIAVDPPWPYELRKADPSHRATHPFPQMSIEQICALDVVSIAHDDCLLWLWTTNHHMRQAFDVLGAWGFQQKTILTWAKDRMGTGDWLRGQTEHCLMAVRGKPIVQLTNQTTLLCGPLRKNSQKPDEFYAFVERLCPAPRYAELFSRQARPNWDGHGDEA